MSEYTHVERPFLAKLRDCKWTVIDQGTGIPQDPQASLRTSFAEVALRETFIQSVGKLNKWATRPQLEYCFDRILLHGNSRLLEANKAAFLMLRKGVTIPGRREDTQEENPTVRIVNFEAWDENNFTAINQFRVETPTMAKQCIIPDIVCFVNGLPWIVVECKDLKVAEPLSDAYTQIKRYSNQRDDEDPYWQPEGKEQLFYPNLFNVITHGKEARFGSISAEFDYYYNWKDIFPETYRTVETKDGGMHQEVIIGGMFNHEILIDILRNFTLFMMAGEQEVKVICRYQQYRAVGKMIEKLKNGKTWQERSGVVWHTQGSGKSLTMVFLVKKMRSTFDLKGYKILMVVDRVDLEEQLSGTANLSGETVNEVDNKRCLVTLSNDTANLNLVMVHKFGVNQDMSMEALARLCNVPKFEVFEEVNANDKVLLLIDEAHRSQGGDMAANLFIAFPNATRIGFTGTPLITRRHKITTAERFCQQPGEYIDTYKMNTAALDRATVDVKYIGKGSMDDLKDREVFDAEYEQIFNKRTEEERQEIQRRYGDMIAYLESHDRVKCIAKDIMDHFVADILSNGFKAMVVGSSIVATVRYKLELERLIPEYIAQEEAKPEADRDIELLARLRILKIRAVISQQSNNEPAYLTSARKEGQGKEVVVAFKKKFNTKEADKADTGIGILCVCDRLLTGFDAPIAQVLYMDKNLREHDLLQAIARVNRTRKGKTHGLVVDYFGITKNLTRALGIYTDREAEVNKDVLLDFGEYFKDINKEIPELELRYSKIVQFFESAAIKDIRAFLDQASADERNEFQTVEAIIEMAADLKRRAELDVLIKHYFDRLDLLFNVPSVQRSHWVRAKRLGYLIARIRDHYKDETLDLKWASEKVRRLIDKHLVSTGILVHVQETSLLSDDFPKALNKLYQGEKSKASAMEHAIRWQIKVDLENSDPGLYQRFKDRLGSVISTYQGNWSQMLKELEELRKQVAQGRPHDDRFSPVQVPFYDLIKSFVREEPTNELDAKTASETKKICGFIKERIAIANVWEKSDEIVALRDRMAGQLRLGALRMNPSDAASTAAELLSLVRNNHIEILRNLDDMARA